MKYTLQIRLLIISLYMLISQPLKSQTTNYTFIDEYVESLIVDRNESFEKLAFRLIKRSQTDTEKVRAIFYWIAKNITYDSKGLNSGVWSIYPSDYKIADDTYMKRRGVCSGYSHLFRLMCEEIGIQSKVINGYSRIEPYQLGQLIKESNHAWNIVNINGEWQNIDVTWASLKGNDDNVNDFYFLTPPNEFITNHLPEDAEWQLLRNHIEKDEFNNYPFITSQYFDLGFNTDFPKNGLIKSSDGTFQICIGIPKNLSLLLKLYDFKSKVWIAPVYRTHHNCDGISVLEIEIKTQGKYLTKVSALDKGQSTYSIYDGILYYIFEYE